MESNEVLDKLPRHLMSLVIDQPYNNYSAQDHAIWRYVMHQNVNYLQHVAHQSYLQGLRRTGVSIDSIPHMYGMNRILKEIGWAAVAVDGFIPPSAFMEFQAYHVLVIAADIRPIDQVEYTPAPDIIHEAAGHAPIIANSEYSQYLVRFGELGSKAFSSARDYELYEAIRHLSIIKADPYSTQQAIQKAALHLENIENNMGEPSEMALIRNLHWWTVEYGLIGSLDKPRIYGAGLLSSIGESYSALTDQVKKLPYTVDAMYKNFDITTKQPQLYVTPDFKHLSEVLEEFAGNMALLKGGSTGVKKAINSANIATCVYSSGLQVTGIFTNVLEQNGEVIFLKTASPSTLSFEGKIIPGQGKDHHADGFSSPVGTIAGTYTPLEFLTVDELESLGISKGSDVKLTFNSGITVSGRFESLVMRDGKIILMSFSSCTVRYKTEVLFYPHWGTYDMAVGSTIVSSFPGPADPEGFGFRYPVPEEKTHKFQHSSENMQLFDLYQQIRDIRENKHSYDELEGIWKKVQGYKNEWLLPLEIHEILTNTGVDNNLTNEIKDYLINLKTINKELEWLITKGLEKKE